MAPDKQTDETDDAGWLFRNSAVLLYAYQGLRAYGMATRRRS